MKKVFVQKQCKNPLPQDRTGAHNLPSRFRPFARAICGAAALALLMGTSAAKAAEITITDQNGWNTQIGPMTMGDFIINPGADIYTHQLNPLQPLSITGTGTSHVSSFSVYGAGTLYVNGPLTVVTVGEGMHIGSEELATPQDGSVTVSKGGMLNVTGEIHLAGEASSTNCSGGKGTLLVDGGHVFMSKDLSIGGESENTVSGGDGLLTVQNGGSVVVANSTRLSGEANGAAPGGRGDILVTGGYFGTTLFTVEPSNLMNTPVTSSLNIQGTGTTLETQAIARLGNQYLGWVSQRQPVATVFDSIMAVGNAVTPPDAEGLNLVHTSWSVGGGTNNDYTFGAKSLTIINTKGLVLTNSPGILLDETVGTNASPTFASGSTLLLAMDGVKPGQTLIAIQDSTAFTGQWTQIYATSRLVENAPSIHSGTDVSIPMQMRDLNVSLPGSSFETRALMTAMATQIGVDSSDDPKTSQAQRFFSRATDYRYVENAADSAPIVESALNAAAAAGIQRSMLTVAQAVTASVENRIKDTFDGNWNGMASQSQSGLAAGSEYGASPSMWIMPLYNTERVSGMKIGDYKAGYSSDLAGLSMGLDLAVRENLRMGLAVNVGAVFAKSKGNFYRTSNNGKFVGVALYGGWKHDNMLFSGDVGYTHTTNSIYQRMPSGMLMQDNKASVDSSALTAGIRGDYRFNAGFMDIVPHVGLRYTALNTAAFDLNNSGMAILAVRANTQHLLTLPVGVTLEKTFTTASGWQVKPLLDLGVIPAVGDLTAKTSSSIPGVAHDAITKADVIDAWTFDGTAGLGLAKDNLNFGLNYNLQASQHRTGHAVSLSLRYLF